MKTSRYWRDAHKFDAFGANLYTERWGEISNFCKELKGLMFLLRQCWSESKYGQYIDTSREFTDRPNAEVRTPEHLGKWDPKAITRILKDNYFQRFFLLHVAMDEIPQQHIASWSEGCECHEVLMTNGAGECLSKYQKEKMFESHYGQKYMKCMLAGNRAPLLAAGYVKATLSNEGPRGMIGSDLE